MANFAVLISGGYDAGGNHPRYLNDLREMYRTLVLTCGYPKSNVFVLYADGRAADLDGDGASEISAAATVGEVTALLGTTLARLITDQDLLFVFTTNHGGLVDATAGRVRLWLWNGSIEDRQFAGLVTGLRFRHLVVCMSQCYSGGFIDDLAGPNRVIATACRHDEPSWACDTEGDFDEFAHHWTAAVRGQVPSGQPVWADLDGDGRVSLRDAFQYAVQNDSRPESPQYFESPSGLGSQLTLSGLFPGPPAPHRACLEHILNAGINLAWAQVFTQHAHPAGDIRPCLERALAHATAALVFHAPEAGIGEALRRLDALGVGAQTLGAIEAVLSHLQGQLRDFVCLGPRRAVLQHVYNLGVNLAWAQTFTQHEALASEVRGALERALAHARAALFFPTPEATLQPAFAALAASGVVPETAAAIWNCVTAIQRELGGYCCDVRP